MSLSEVHLVGQDLSVAGKRAGLAGKRSGLFMDQIRIIKEMREKDAKSGRTGADIRPRFMVWENVGGCQSVNDGKDFAAVLEETLRVAEPEMPDIHVPEGGWTLSGSYVGRRSSVAWRVLDAQFWGVPQRRRRIALIADFGGQCAAKVLFESNSLYRHLKPSEAQGQTTSGDAENCSGTASRSGSDRAYGVVSKGNGDAFIAEERHTALSTGGGEAGQGYPCVMTSETDGVTGSDRCLNPWDVQSKHIQPENGVAETLWAGEARYGGGESYVMQKSDAEPIVLESNQNHATITDTGVSPTLSASMGMGGGYVPMVTDTIAIEGNGTRESHLGAGFSESDQMYTLNTVEQHSVCYGISAFESNAMKSDNPNSGIYIADTARTLDLQGGNPACNQGGIAIVEGAAGFCPNAGVKAEGIGYMEEQSPTLRTTNDAGVVYPDVSRTLTARNDGSPCVDRGPDVICLEMTSTKNTVSDDGVCPTLTARMGTGGNQVNAVVQESPEVDTFAMQGFGDYIKSDVVSSCRARDYKDATDLICSSTGERQNATTPAKKNTRYIVRRLTPLECTRLQGYPDKWLDIGDWYDDNGKLHKESDSTKYKALGNSIAIPPWLFVLGELNQYCDDKGMGSLFDGISGFPLIWSFLNGKENCVWSSEIDSFCNAVSRIRFPDTSDQTEDTKK